MKNLKLILLATFTLILYSCSSDDDSNNDSDNGNLPNGGLLIQKIENGNPASWDTGDTYYYEEGKLKFLMLSGCSGLYYYFEYNSANKISKTYEASIYSADYEVMDVNGIVANESPIVHVYENNKLIRLETPFEGNTYIISFYSYYDNGKLESREVPGGSKFIIYYDNDIISEILYYNLYSDGDVITYTFEFDDKFNPFYEEFNYLGIVDIIICREFNNVLNYRHHPLFKNNAKRVYEDNVLRYSATYYYNDENYPERIITTDHSDGNQESIFITY